MTKMIAARDVRTVDVDLFAGGDGSPFYHTRSADPPPIEPADPATPPVVAGTIDASDLQLLIRSSVTDAVRQESERLAMAQPPLGAGVHSSRTRATAGFSLLKMIGFLANRFVVNSRSYELEMATKWHNAAIACGWKPAGQGTGFSIPLSADLADSDLAPLAIEIRSAMAAYTESVDPDQLFHARSRLPAWYTRDLSPLVDTSGGSLIPLAAQGDLIELLRAKSVLTRAGARIVPLPANGSGRYPRQTSAGTGYWVGVQQTITESTPGTGFLTVSAKKIAAMYDMPNEFFRFANPAIETFVRADLMHVLSLGIDKAGLEGAANGLEIKGLLNWEFSAADTPTAGKIQLVEASTTGANGDTVAYADGDKMLTALEEANASSESAVFVMRPAKRRHIFSRRADAVTAADSAGMFLGLPTIGQRPRSWFEAPVYTTTQLTNNRAKGAATNLTPIICGDFTDYLLAMMGMLEIAWNPNDSTLFAQDATRVRAIQQCDGAPRRPESFAVMDDLLPTA